MKNILTFEDYKNLNIKQVESLIYHQFIDEDINNKNEVNEGFIRKSINKAAGKFIQNALADEIEKGKELEKSIKEALDGLNAGFDSIKKQIDTNDKDSANQKMDAIEKIKELFENNLGENFFGYSAWNTSANTLGSLICGAKVKYFAKKLNQDAFKKLQVTRFLDDWAYQANVRQTLSEPDVEKITTGMKEFEKKVENILKTEVFLKK